MNEAGLRQLHEIVLRACDPDPSARIAVAAGLEGSLRILYDQLNARTRTMQ